MKKTVIRYSLFSILSLFLFVILPFVYSASKSMEDIDMDQSEILGWAGIILSQLLVVLAIKNYRDKVQHGKLTYLEGLKLGTLIALTAGVIFGLASYVLYEFIYPEFTEAYYAHYEEGIRNSGAAPEVIEAQLSDLAATPEWLMSSWMGGILMFGNVFPTGFVISLIASAFLYRKEKDGA